MTGSTHSRSSITVLLVLATATLIASLGVSIASILLPTLSYSFAATVSDVQWVVLAYLMTVTLTIVLAGRLADLFGHRTILIAGLAIFIIASAVCAMAPTLGVLIAGRVIQGLGGAILIALPMSIARHSVSTKRLGSVMGLLGTTSAVGTALGPSLGGALLTWGDWRMAFWGLAGVAAVTLILAVTALHRDVEKAAVSLQELDIPGAFVLMIALAAYALAASGGADGVSLPIGALIVAVLVAMSLFVLVETRASSPLVPMSLLRERRTGVGFVMNLLIGTVMMSTLVVGPFYLTFALGLNEALVGLILAVGPIVAALAGVPAGRLTDRFGADRIIVAGLGQTVVGLLCLAYLPHFFGVGGYVVALITLTPSFQLFLAANNTAVLLDASMEERGRLSGLLGLSRNLGLMTGASAMSTLFVLFLGTGDASQAPVADIAHAFTLTFTAAAGLALIALGLAVFDITRESDHIGQSAE